MIVSSLFALLILSFVILIAALVTSVLNHKKLNTLFSYCGFGLTTFVPVAFLVKVMLLSKSSTEIRMDISLYPFLLVAVSLVALVITMSSGEKKRDMSFVNNNSMLIVLVLVVLFFEVVLTTSTGRGFLSASNITNLIRQNGYIIILATGMLLCILTGGNIDLSVGSVVVLVGSISGIFIVDWKMDPYLTIVLCLLIGTAIGAWQAFWIAYVRVPPFVTTLAGMLMFRGLALWMTNSQNKAPYPSSFINLFSSYLPGTSEPLSENLTERMPYLNMSLVYGLVICAILVSLQIISRIQKKRKGYALDNLMWTIVRLTVVCAVVLFVFGRIGEHRGIPVVLIWIGVIVLIYNYYTQNTIPGRYLYAMGGNEKAARLSGINTRKMMFFAYTNMGFLSAVAALICVARMEAANTGLGVGFELDAIGACFIGGASAYGGVGKVGGAVIGAVFMGVLNMGMSLLGLNQNLQQLIKGSVLLAAVVFDVLNKRRKQAA
jgi:putative multiple sugar transport system permease protein